MLLTITKLQVDIIAFFLLLFHIGLSVWVWTYAIIKVDREKTEKKLYAKAQLNNLKFHEHTLELLSQELHDNVCQILGFTKLCINNVDINNTHQVKIGLLEVKELVSQAIHDLRDLSKTLNPGFIIDVGLAESIQFHLGILERTKNWQIKFQECGDLYRQEPVTNIILFRAVQELLNNIVKHADATCIEVTLDYQATKLLIKIEDNGKGFSPSEVINENSGLGLQNIRKRMDLINGRISINSIEQQGTTATITVPVRMNRNRA